MDKEIKPFIKWAGGKEKELKYIKACLPEKIDRYIEPFVGGGAVYFDMNIPKSYINDKSTELMDLYKCVKDSDESFIDYLKQIDKGWKKVEKFVENNTDKLFAINAVAGDTDTEKKLKKEISEFTKGHKKSLCNILPQDIGQINSDNFIKEVNKNLNSKFSRMHKIELEKGKLSQSDTLDNIECAFKSAFYMHMRYLYNNAKELNVSKSLYSALFYFIREFCYASMFRYNADGKFNVPYGGISYNRKEFSKKISYVSSEKLKTYMLNTSLYTDDFENFMNKLKLSKNDFIFLDPPYDTEFSTYAQNTFDKKDQIRLANYLKSTKAKFMLVIKNTDFIYNLYNVDGFKIQTFDKNYLVSFQNRNDKDVEHLLITNY